MGTYQGIIPGKGYVDFKYFYNRNEIADILSHAKYKVFKEEDPLEGRAYLVMKEMPDAKVGTVLRPTIEIETGELTTGEWQDHYGYHSKYVGRASFLHMEIVHRESDWFWRIN